MLPLLHPELNNAIEKCKSQIKKLKEYMHNKTTKINGKILQDLSKSAKEKDELFTLPPHSQTRYRKLLEARGKIIALDCHKYSNQMVAASQEGALYIADAVKLQKLNRIPISCYWLTTCAYSLNGKFVASGGCDNLVQICKADVQSDGVMLPPSDLTEIFGHEDYIGDFEYLDDNQILTGSGDGSCILWDIEKRISNTKFTGHLADVCGISIHENNKSVFISGSVDATAKLWDMRAPMQAVETFRGHEGDINCCEWFPNGSDFVFATGSDDSTVRLWDFRSRQQLNVYMDNDVLGIVMDLHFSKSGYYVFACYDDNPWGLGWNTMTGEKQFSLPHDDHRVTSLQVTPDGYQIVTGCWDKFVRLWTLRC